MEHDEEQPDAESAHAEEAYSDDDTPDDFAEDEYEEPITDRYDLRALSEKFAMERRRTTAGVLRVQRSAKDEVVLELDRSETTIGRDPACDIVVTGPGISRRHASIRRTDAGYFELRDLRSTNGTLVNQDPIREMILLDQDRFRIGDIRFQLEIHTVEFSPEEFVPE